MTISVSIPPYEASGSGSDLLLRRQQLDEAITLEAAGPGSWRVCDSRIQTGFGRFVAFVEFKGDAFEVMQLADDFTWASFPTMRAAITHIVETQTSPDRTPSPADVA